MMKYLLQFLLLIPTIVWSQNLPKEVKITPDGRLTYGGNVTEGLYSLDEVNKLELTFVEPNWFQLLDGIGGGPWGGNEQTLIGKLTFNDVLTLDSVLVSIKGLTSDFLNDSEKKSFKIEIDEIINQDLMGYDNLNLNCGFQDESSMREVLYYDIAKHFAPALKGTFIDLYINGNYWGPYSNIQQIEGRYIQEWFTDNEGTRWRAFPTNDFGGPGGIFGTGYSTLNYNGPAPSDYEDFYILKKTSKDNPWEDLIETCEQLNNLPIEDLYDDLKYKLDIDRTLWILAQEIVFSDDDSYIYKGGMDYYVYWDHATDRIMPLEVDGNSVMILNNLTWNPFYHEGNPDFPLMNRLMQNTEIRQRYLAHLRTILTQHFTVQEVHDRIDEFAAILNQKVINDPKKIYTYNQFVNGVDELKSFITNRNAFLSGHNEIDRQGVDIDNLTMESAAGPGIAPQPGEAAQITVEVGEGEAKVMLYYGLGLDGVFERVEMFDDGMHGDELANDNIYGALLPAFFAGNYVRYYVEAIKDDASSTASYFPEGAEHDVFVYQVVPAILSPEDVVINELMANNESTASDIAGEFGDWIELYNKGNETIDLSGYSLSDDDGDIVKWTFPDGTSIEPDGYLIIWADSDEGDTTPDELHANFKLSSSGEVLILVNADGEITDRIAFGEQQDDVAFARIPNGTGDFQSRTATFGANNDGSTTSTQSVVLDEMSVYPNPVSDHLMIDLQNQLSNNVELTFLNATGQQVLNKSDIVLNAPIDVSNLGSGIYFMILQDLDRQARYYQKITILK
ncbi:MAG: CotH kinase family protein [Bacteroidota bacterium]